MLHCHVKYAKKMTKCDQIPDRTFLLIVGTFLFGIINIACPFVRDNEKVHDNPQNWIVVYLLLTPNKGELVAAILVLNTDKYILSL